MKHIKLATIFIFFFLALVIDYKNVNAQQWVSDMQDTSLTFEQKQASFNSYWSNKDYEKGKGYKQFKRIEYFQLNRIGNNGKLKLPQNRVSDYKAIQKSISTAKSIGVAGKWVQLGPFGPANGGGSGRINCIDFHPTNSSKLIIGAPSGGIWRSDNGGSSWTTNTDDLASIGFSDIKYAPSNANIIYAASGDIDGNDTYTIGVLKSTNGGNTWNTTGLSYDYTHKRKTYRLLVHPTDPDIVYVSTSMGFYKTTDGGQTWNRKKLGSYKDIKFKPGSPNTIYLASANKIFISTDAGATFTTKLTINGSSRIELAVTTDDSNYLYALSGKSSDGGYNGIYQSVDGGNNFTKKSSSPNVLGWAKAGNDQGGQAWYDLALTVSPVNKNKLFVGGVNMWTSSNGGATWSIAGYWLAGYGVPYVHADIHMLKYSTHNSGTLWACTDGGVSKSTNNGSSWNEENNLLSIAQMYRMGGSKTNANKIMTGWQDNGSNLMTSSWNFVLGGDGMECIISHSNNMTIYGSIYNGEIRRSYNGGSSWSSISGSISEPGAWVTPYIMDDNNSSLLLAGYKNVWRTQNKGNSWTKISNWSTSYTLNALASAGTNSSIIWTANATTLYKTINGGQNWTTVSGSIGGGSVTSIAINKADPDKVWITKSGFSNGQKVYQTLDGGTTWTNISNSLPNYPVNTIVNAPNTANGLYIGTDLGVYYYDTNLNDWVPFMKDLPNVIVNELELFEAGDKIRAATYGRGLWESVTYPYATSIENYTSSNLNVKIYPNPANDFINIELEQVLQKNTKLTIINNIGSIIRDNISLNNSKTSINTSNLPHGIYFFRITSDTYSSVYKVIIN
ncbi:MAG: T9SS type A sorting domain-containing protein [Bacteroidales bacterium]|nr:T9SS type A sorting domain-containing protein [Bacteroidales bacterium]